MTALKFNKVKTLPTSGYNEGDVYFVKSEKKIYVRTATGWEDYSGDGSGGGVASKLEVHNYDNPDPIVHVTNHDDNDLLIIEDSSGDTYFGLNMILTKYNETGGGSYDYYDNNICGKGLILRRVKNGSVVDSTTINPYGIYINRKTVITEGNIRYYLPIRTHVLSSNTAETYVPDAYTGTVILTNSSGKKTIKLPAGTGKYDGRTIIILRTSTSNGQTPQFEVNTQDGTQIIKANNQTSAYNYTFSNGGKYTCIYSSSQSRWYIMRDDFVSL